MPKETNQPDPQDSSKPASASSSGEGQSLDSMRGVNPAFLEMDDQNAVEDSTLDDAPDALEQMLSADNPTEEDDDVVEDVDDPADGGDDQELVDAEVDDDVAALQERLLESDKDRTKRAQESAYLKGKLSELDPFIQVGIAVRENPQLSAYVDAVLSGRQPTQKEQAAGDKAASKAGMSPEEFLAAVEQRVSARVSQQVQQTLDSQAAASRHWDKIDTRARKELKHYDAVQKHPAFLGWVSAMNQSIDNGTLLVPEGEDPNYFAIAKAHDVMIATNPDYIKAVHSAGVKKGKKSVAKKLAGAGPGASASRGSTAPTGKKLTQDEKDRVSMLRAFLKGGTGRRLPGAR